MIRTLKRRFHDVEYSVSMEVTNDTLLLECENRSLDKWKATFTAKFVEEITHRTGNFKTFGVFVKMLSSAFDSDSSTVNLDLLTSEDLEALRQASGISSGSRLSCSETARSKRYLILTYQGEFDKVHYPMALTYSDVDDVIDLKRTIVQLRDEIDILRNRPLDCGKENLSRDNERLSKDLNACLLENNRLLALVETLERENRALEEKYTQSLRGPRIPIPNRRGPQISQRRDLSRASEQRRDYSPNLSRTSSPGKGQTFQQRLPASQHSQRRSMSRTSSPGKGGPQYVQRRDYSPNRPSMSRISSPGKGGPQYVQRRDYSPNRPNISRASSPGKGGPQYVQRRDYSPKMSNAQRRDYSPNMSNISRTSSPGKGGHRNVSPRQWHPKDYSPTMSQRVSDVSPIARKAAKERKSVPAMSEVDARLEALQNFLRHQKQALIN